MTAALALKLSTSTPAVVWAVHDGDTFTALVKLNAKQFLGVDLWAEMSLRLAGCNARDLTQPGGVEARQNLVGRLPLGAPILVTVTGTDKYGGRMDARIALPDGGDLVSELVAGQWAAAWNGSGTKPVPPWPREVP